jgi:hypothetical protein
VPQGDSPLAVKYIIIIIILCNDAAATAYVEYFLMRMQDDMRGGLKIWKEGVRAYSNL